MNFEQALGVANTIIFANTGRRLADVEVAVLQGAWQGQTYEEIAEAYGYSASYLKQGVGPKLWKLLSHALGEPVSKTNFRGALERSHKSYSESRESREAGGELAPRPSATLRLRLAPLAPHADWGEAIDVSNFYGRNAELATLKRWVVMDRCRLIALLGMGGIGKTALSVKLAQEIQQEFDCLIWRSLRNAPLLETLLGDLVPFLSNQQDTEATLSRLLHWLRTSRCLVILDNMETILQAGERVMFYIC